MVPLWLSIIPQITASPSPFPFCPFVEKKGSKIFGKSSLLIPLPVSETLISINSLSPAESTASHLSQLLFSDEQTS